MEKKEEQRNKKKSFLNLILCLSFLVLIILILIIVNAKENSNSSEEISKVEDIMNYMKESNITIYGSSTCPACKKQLNEFEPYQEEAINEGVFVLCDITQDIGCIGVTSVPAWKINNEIVHVGYLPLEDIKNEIK